MSTETGQEKPAIWAEENRLYHAFIRAVTGKQESVESRVEAAHAVLDEMDALKSRCLEEWDVVSSGVVSMLANHLTYSFPSIVDMYLSRSEACAHLSAKRLEKRMQKMAENYREQIGFKVK